MNEIETLETQQRYLVEGIASREAEIKKLRSDLAIVNRSLKTKTKGKNIDFVQEIIRVALEEGPMSKHDLTDNLKRLYPNKVYNYITTSVNNVILKGFLKIDDNHMLIKGRDASSTKIGRKEDILKVIRDSDKPLTASDISDLIGVDIINLRTQLSRLIQLNLVTRTLPPYLRKGTYAYSLPEHANV